MNCPRTRLIIDTYLIFYLKALNWLPTHEPRMSKVVNILLVGLRTLDFTRH